MGKTKNSKIELGISRDFGRGLVFHFRMDAIVEFEDAKQLSVHARELEFLVLGQLERFAVESLAKVQGGIAPTVPIEESGEVLEGGVLLRNYVDGKVQYKWKVGKYVKYGLPIFEEVILKSGIKFDGSEVQKDMTGWHCKLHVSPEGKAKVIKAWRNE